MWCPKTCGGVCPLPTEGCFCHLSTNNYSSVLQKVIWFAAQNVKLLLKIQTLYWMLSGLGKKLWIKPKHCSSQVGALHIHLPKVDMTDILSIDPQKSIQLTTNLIPIAISAGLVPAAHPLLALSRLNTSLLITHLPIAETLIEEIHSPQVQADFQDAPQRLSQKDVQEALDEAIRSATRSNTGLSQILTEGHPIRGIALAELGKLLSVDEPHPTHLIPPTTSASLSSSLSASLIVPPAYPPSGPQRLKLAYQTLKEARSELTIGFGGGRNEGGEVGQDVRRQVAELEKELDVWKAGLRNVYEDRPKPSMTR